MKKILTLLAAVSLLAFTACNKEKDEPAVIPQFPAEKTGFVTPETPFSMSVTPNLDWEVSISASDEDAAWFRLLEEGSDVSVYTIRGTAGQTKAFSVITEGADDFDRDRVCELKMTMGGKTQTIARVTRASSVRTLTLYAVQIDDEGYFMYGEEYAKIEDGGSIALAWPEGSGGYMRAIAVEANFEWVVKSTPEWLPVPDFTVTDGRQTARLQADPAKYPLSDDEGQIVFADKNNAEATYTYTVTIAGCADRFVVTGTMPAVSNFNADGEFDRDGSWLPQGPFATIETATGYKLYTFTKVSQPSGDYYDIEGADWIKAVITDNESDGDVIRNLRLQVNVEPNTSNNEREGLVFVLPKAVIDNLIEAGTEEADIPYMLAGGEVNADYEQYLITRIAQQGVPMQTIISAVSSAEEMSAMGISFKTLGSEADWIRRNWDVTEVHELAYTSMWNNEDMERYLHVDADYSEVSFEYYDFNEGPMKEDEWLGAMYLSASKNISIAMYPEKDKLGDDASTIDGVAHKGFIIIYGDGQPFAALSCVFDENYDTSGGNQGSAGDGTVEFATPGQVQGATLIPITGDNYWQFGIDEVNYNEYLGTKTSLYALTYTSANPSNAVLNVPAGYTISIMPWGLEWLECNPGNYEISTSQMTITMTKPGEDDPEIGMVQFVNSMNYQPKTVIYCVPAF